MLVVRQPGGSTWRTGSSWLSMCDPWLNVRTCRRVCWNCAGTNLPRASTICIIGERPHLGEATERPVRINRRKERSN